MPCQFPAIVISSNVWGRDSGGEWECSSVIIFCDELRQKQKLLGGTSETCTGLGFGALIDSFSPYSLSIYHVPGTPFSTVGTPWWTQQVRPFLSWRWHGLVCKAAFHSHCLDFQCPQFSALEDVPSIFQLLVWNLLPVNEVIFWGTERDYTHSVYKSRGGKSSCRLFKICTDIQAWLTQSWAPAQECAVSTTTILHKNPH